MSQMFRKHLDEDSGTLQKLTSVISQNALMFSVPVPDHDGAVFRTGDDVTVLVNVALGPPHAGHKVKVPVNNLHDFS